jgi:outer membrane receptor protein involved in Fe transport
LEDFVRIFADPLDDLITAVPVTGPISQEYRNSGERKGHGGEFELTYAPLDEVKLSANYAYQKSIDKQSDDDVGEAPNHQIYARLDWNVTTHWRFVTQVNWVGEQKRTANDTRPPVDDYTTVDINLRAVDLLPDWAFSVAVKNLFDQDVRDPSPYADPAPEIPNDFPMPGRQFVAELRYQF